MTRLLVSVRSAEEAQLALEGGAHLVDVKEPSRGSLGAADGDAIRAIVEQVAGRVPLSVALGELLEEDRRPTLPRAGIGYAKLGLAGCAARRDWQSVWRRAMGAVSPQIVPVAVAYADWQTALAPLPGAVLSAARELGCGAVLIDTHDKSNGALLDHVSLGELRTFIAAARHSRLVCVVAGSLGLAEIGAILPLAPDYVAVRGAACVSGRAGTLDAARVAGLAAAVARSGASQLAGASFRRR